MRMSFARLLAVVALVLLPFAAQAQVTPSAAIVVASCGTLPLAYVQGRNDIITQDTTGKLCVNATVSATITFPSFGATYPSTGIAIGVESGGNLVGVNGDGSGNLDVNCVVGCSGGILSNASDGVATSSGNDGSNSWLYGFNGTTFDRLRSDTNKYLYVDLGAGIGFGATGSSVPASAVYVGASVGGTLTGLVATANGLKIDGSAITQPISGSITANAGTNLNTSALALESGGNLATLAGTVSAGKVSVLATNAGTFAVQATQSGTWTDTVTQATASALNATVVGTGTFAVQATQATSPWVDNITQVGGSALALGQTTKSASVPVTLASDQGSVSVAQTTASSLKASVGGLAASGATASGNPVLIGGQAQNAEITAVTNGQAVTDARDLVGKEIVMPFANKENFLNGTASTTSATNTSLIGAQGTGLKIYLTAFSCSNTGASASLVQFTSGSGGTVIWQTMNPAGGGANMQITPPVATAAVTALFMTTGTASTTQSCSVTGYAGT